MPITINGSGTVTGISAGGLPDGVITTDDIAANAVTTAKLGSGEASGLCKAWVNFNGTGTVAIRASYNVSSITDNGVGSYTVNFTTAMADANYVFMCSATDDNTAARFGCELGTYGEYRTASVLRLRFFADSGSVNDVQGAYVAIFR